jgi:hypothetical protein
MELGDPLVDHLATEAQPIRHLWYRVALVQPQQRLGTPQLLRLFGRGHKMFQRFSLFGIQGLASHQRTS